MGGGVCCAGFGEGAGVGLVREQVVKRGGEFSWLAGDDGTGSGERDVFGRLDSGRDDDRAAAGKRLGDDDAEVF